MKTEVLAAESITQSVRRAFCRSVLTLAWEFGRQKPDGRRSYSAILAPASLPGVVAARFPIEDPSSPVSVDFGVSVKEIPAQGNGYVLGIFRKTLELDESGLFGRSTWSTFYSTRQLVFEGADPTINCSVEVEGIYEPPAHNGLDKPLPIELTPPIQPPLDTRELRTVMRLAYMCVDQLRLA